MTLQASDGAYRSEPCDSSVPHHPAPHDLSLPASRRLRRTPDDAPSTRLAGFSRRSTELSFESIVRLEHSPREITCTVPGSGREVPCRSSGYVNDVALNVDLPQLPKLSTRCDGRDGLCLRGPHALPV
jgi:hypothetical protein